MSRAHRGEPRRITHRRQRRDGVLDRRHCGRAMLGQAPPRELVHRCQRIEQQRARDHHARVAKHHVGVHAALRNG
jgi:hypothetical protein